jgi:hypothetical protein
MLDFSRLKTPPDDGEVLVEPAPAEWTAALRTNHARLRTAKVRVLDSTLAEWRSRTRERILGRDDQPIVVIGHQPDFIHAGVWAKHVVARRFADAMNGLATNLVVDSDSPRTTNLLVPAVRNDRSTICPVACTDPPGGRAFEQILAVEKEGLERIGNDVRRCMGERFHDSMVPVFLDGLSRASAARDWVDQTTAGRRAVDSVLGVALDDRRVSGLWWTPLLRDVTANARRFVTSYNRALGEYRRANQVRGRQRPIPDLATNRDTCELPFWAYRRGEPRRRLFATLSDEQVLFLAGREPIGRFRLADAAIWDELTSPLPSDASWRVRPRALALTLWARLFLADLFIHGIGGAKYDRISDAIIADYYRLPPPDMACVSATVRLPLLHGDTTPRIIREMRHSIRDLQWNPQRHSPDDGSLAELKLRREQTVQRAVQLRERSPENRAARRDAFEEIRRQNRALLAARPDLLAARRDQLQRGLDELAHNRVALDREYFYALHSRTTLQRIGGALPSERDFGLG